MRRRIKAAALLTGIALCLIGCRLANPDAGETRGRDRLAGVFVTRESLDLFDAESWLTDNLNDVWRGKTEIDAEDAEKYGGRVYAELVEQVFTDSAGDEQRRYEYVFPNLEGRLIGSFFIQTDETSGFLAEGYWLSVADEGIDSKTYFNSTDDGEDIRHDATIYVSADAGNATFYFNPVYQTTDGAVYLTAGGGIYAGNLSEGSMTHTLTDSATERENGKEKTVSTEIRVTAQGATPPERVAVIQMDEENREICRGEYPSGGLPDEIVPDARAAYLLIEERYADDATRSLCQRGDDTFSIFCRLDDLVCAKEFVSVRWGEE